jgi:hypothetical protein
MRIDKFLSNMGYGSRKEVKILLKSESAYKRAFGRGNGRRRTCGICGIHLFADE